MSTSKLPNTRFAPASPHGRDALSYFLMLAVAACVIAIGLLVFSAFKPLGREQIDPLLQVAGVPSVEPGALAQAERQRLVDGLTAQNYFAFGRGEWVRPTRLAQGSETTTEPETRPVPAANLNAGDTRVVNSRGEVVNVLEKEDLSTELQRALENLKLRALFADASGTPYAMITRKHEEQASHSTSFKAGDEFIEKNAASVAWRVEFVDLEAKRVALSRSGQTVWLNLRDRAIRLALAGAGASNRVFDPATSIPVVEELTRAELRAELIKAGLSATDVDGYFALADALDAPPAPEPDARLTELASIVKDVNAPQNSDDESATPSDIEALLQMMANNEPPTPEMLEKFNNPKPEKKDGEEDDQPDQ